MSLTTQRYEQLFTQLDAKQQGAFVPFVTVGDPNLAQSEQIIEALIAGGADALELGIPFSDPQADGPTIQKANFRALAAGATSADCFNLLHRVRERHPNIPMGLLVYANLVYSRGIDDFYQRCADAGVDSVLIADVPTTEIQRFKPIADAAGIETILIAPPNGSDQLMQEVSELGSGYTYLLSRAGVTGAETKAKMPVTELLNNLKRFNAPPALLGFGIAEPSQVQEAIHAGAAGAISGSAVVNLIEKYIDQPEQQVAELEQFVRSMKAATQK